MKKSSFGYLLLSIVLITAIGLTGCAGAKKNADDDATIHPPSPEVTAAYQKAENLFKTGNFSAAYKITKNLHKKTKNKEQQSRTRFLATECLFHLKKYEKVADIYDNYLKLFPQSEYLSQVIQRKFEIGFMYLDGKNRTLFGLPILPAIDWGMNTIRHTLENHPYAEPSEIYHLKLADTLFRKKKFEDARLEYEVFLKTYPKSQAAAHALLSQGLCRLKEYLGPNYDQDPLLQSEQIFDKFLFRFPQSPLLDQARQLQLKTISRLAERDYATACFYLETNRPKAANVYFTNVIQEYPGTPWAEKARARLNQPAKKKIPVEKKQ